MQNPILGIFFITALFFSAVSLLSAQDLQNARRNLMPVPQSVKWGNAKLRISKTFSVALIGETDERLRQYLIRFVQRLEGRTVLELSHELSAVPDGATLQIKTASTGNAIPRLGDDESYLLVVNEKQANLTANTTVGAMRGLETFLQLLEGDNDGPFVPSVSINDRPRFQWRGLLIDSARHFQPMDVIRRNLDAMAAVKLNVLHWHLTEDQGFRIESKKFPELHQLGSDGNYYTQDEVREIIKYAAYRGIRVMPEFDMPGHATAWLVSHPEIGSGPGPFKIERQPGVFDPTMDPTNEKTYKLLEVFFKEMSGLFPDAYMHIGGDENEGKQWNANAKIQAFMKEKGLKDKHELQTYFNTRVLKFLQKDGKIMMGWDEIFQPSLPKDVVIHSWRGQAALAEAAKQGYSGVLSSGYYIDLMFPASQHYVVDPLPRDTPLSTEEQKRILGGEATMWSEWVSPETIDSRIWPRTAAIAERLWSDRDVNDVDDMYRRLGIVSIHLEELGLTHLKNQAVLLRRLANSRDISSLKILVSLIEPVNGYQRFQQRPQSMLSPLTGLVDAAQPDADGARQFDRVVNGRLSDKSLVKDSAEIRTVLAEWMDVSQSLKQLMANAPSLSEDKQLATDLGDLSKIGLEALFYIENRTPPPSGWSDEMTTKLKELSKPKAAVELKVTGSIKLLVDAAARKEFKNSPQVP